MELTIGNENHSLPLCMYVAGFGKSVVTKQNRKSGLATQDYLMPYVTAIWFLVSHNIWILNHDSLFIINDVPPKTSKDNKEYNLSVLNLTIP